MHVLPHCRPLTCDLGVTSSYERKNDNLMGQDQASNVGEVTTRSPTQLLSLRLSGSCVLKHCLGKDGRLSSIFLDFFKMIIFLEFPYKDALYSLLIVLPRSRKSTEKIPEAALWSLEISYKFCLCMIFFSRVSKRGNHLAKA